MINSTAHIWILRSTVLVILLFVTGAIVASPPLGAPFVQNLNVRVIDPAAYDRELAEIDSFAYLLVLPKSNQILAAFRLSNGRLGVLRLHATRLSVLGIHWIDPIDTFTPRYWRGCFSMGTTSAGFVVANPNKEGTNAVGVEIVVYDENSSNPWETHRVSFPQEPVAITAIPQKKQVVCLTKPSNIFLTYDLTNGKVEQVDEIFDFVPYAYPYGRCLYRSGDGTIYGSYKGRLFSYDPETQFFEYLGMLPGEFGHLSETALSAMVEIDQESLLVGATTGSGYLFTLDRKARKVRPWGKPSDATDIRKLVYAGSSGFWGIAVTPNQACRLFQFQPDYDLLKDHGMVAGVLSDGNRSWTWHAYQIADMIVLPGSRILLAEASRQAKLLVFNPPEKDADND